MNKIFDEEFICELQKTILSNPKKQKRLKSSTFWNKLKIERRNAERIARILNLLEEFSIFPSVADFDFGFEPKNEWITFSFVEPNLPTDFSILDSDENNKTAFVDSWFTEIQNRKLRSEREVEYFFVLPLLEKLGYLKEDIAIGYRISMNQGSTKLRKEADIVAFKDGNQSDETAILLIEAKSSDKPITDDFIRQVRSYAMWLFVPYYVVTNGLEFRVYLFRGSLQSDIPLLNFKKSELHLHWEDLYKILNKSAVINYKEKLKEHFKKIS